MFDRQRSKIISQRDRLKAVLVTCDLKEGDELRLTRRVPPECLPYLRAGEADDLQLASSGVTTRDEL